MFHEYEVRHRVSRSESEFFQFAFCPPARLHDPAACIREMLSVVQRLFRCRHGHAVYIVRIEAELYLLHVVYHFFAGHAPSDAQSGEAEALRRRPAYHEVVIPVNERRRGFGSEVHIRLVDHHEMISVRLQQFFYLIPADGEAGRRVRVRYNDCPVHAFERVEIQ